MSTYHELRSSVPALLLAILVSATAQADVITDWNAKAEAIAVEKRTLPPPNARGMTILHVAMFEAVNAVDRRYAPYRSKLEADKGISKKRPS